MTTRERLKFIAAKVRKNPLAVRIDHLPPKPKPEGKGRWKHNLYGVALREADRRTEWFQAADKRPNAAFKPKQKRGPHALTKIAHTPRKLPKLSTFSHSLRLPS